MKPLLLKARWRTNASALALLCAAAVLWPEVQAQTQAEAVTQRDTLKPCRLRGVEFEAQCGTVTRALDPAAPDGRKLQIHFAVLPALARNKHPDPIFFFAGGPGQSAMQLAGPLSRQFARFSNRRDVVLIDQRGTGQSAPLACDADAPSKPLREMADPALQASLLRDCRAALQKLPHGDLRQYTTGIAMADADAVRRALGAERINVIGGSYGTRAVLEYLRQFPGQVRRAVIDGVAPPDMVLPVSFSTDAQAALDATLAACESEAACKLRFPALRAQWAALLASLPREVRVPHPVTGRDESFTLSHDMLASMVRMPLYVPSLAAALPFAVSEAAQGRFVPLVGLAGAVGGRRDGEMRLAMGMHLSVICAEDAPRIASAADKPGADFGSGYTDFYRKACEGWPRGEVPSAFYQMPPAQAAVLVLSGGLDPVTPPRHGERAAKALGVKARHVVVPNAGHGVMSVGCMPDVLFRFIDAASDDAALKVETRCVESIPRPPAFRPVQAATSAASAASGGAR